MHFRKACRVSSQELSHPSQEAVSASNLSKQQLAHGSGKTSVRTFSAVARSNQQEVRLTATTERCGDCQQATQVYPSQRVDLSARKIRCNSKEQKRKGAKAKQFFREMPGQVKAQQAK